MVLVTLVMKEDLVQHHESLAALTEEVQGDTALTDLRLMDILAWTKSRGEPLELRVFTWLVLWAIKRSEATRSRRAAECRSGPTR